MYMCNVNVVLIIMQISHQDDPENWECVLQRLGVGALVIEIDGLFHIFQCLHVCFM